MGYSKMSALLILAVAVVAAMAGARVAEAQPACAQQLVPCADYLNSTSPPPASCCDPLRRAVTEERDCLCNLYRTPGLLTGFGINITQALLLPGRCGVSGNLSACTNASGPTSSTTPPPPGESGRDNNGVGRIASVGTATLLLFWALIVFY